MLIKSYQQVSPTSYLRVSEGVQIREMNTAHDGAPNFAMRVFDVQADAGTPFHIPAWEHEVYIIPGIGLVRRSTFPCRARTFQISRSFSRILICMESADNSAIVEGSKPSNAGSASNGPEHRRILQDMMQCDSGIAGGINGMGTRGDCCSPTTKPIA